MVIGRASKIQWLVENANMKREELTPLKDDEITQLYEAAGGPRGIDRDAPSGNEIDAIRSDPRNAAPKPKEATQKGDDERAEYKKIGGDLPQIKRKDDHQNRVLDMLLPAGGKDFNKVDRPLADFDTETYARLADYLNNALYYDPSVVTTGSGGFGYANRGDIKQPPKMDSEDLRMQDKRRDFENTRRTWNSGLLQESKVFDQQMKLAEDWLQKLNDVQMNGIRAAAIHDEADGEMKGLLVDFAHATPDQRGWFRMGIEMLLQDLLRALR